MFDHHFSLLERGFPAECSEVTKRMLGQLRRPGALVVLLAVSFEPFGVFTVTQYLGIHLTLSEGQSMHPTHPGRAFGVSVPYFRSRPSRGDVVALPDPAGSAAHFGKRVIGLPGETVSISAEGVSINGRLLAEPYIVADPAPAETTWELAADEYFVMGDNRPASLDSRYFGPVQAEKLSRLGIVLPLAASDAWAVGFLASGLGVCLISSLTFAIAAARCGRSTRVRVVYGALGFCFWGLGLVIAWFRRPGRPGQDALATGGAAAPVELSRSLSWAIAISMGILSQAALFLLIPENGLNSTFAVVMVMVAPAAVTWLLRDRALYALQAESESRQWLITRVIKEHLFWFCIVVALAPAAPLEQAIALIVALAIELYGPVRARALEAYRPLVLPAVIVGLMTVFVPSPYGADRDVSVAVATVVVGFALYRAWAYRMRPALSAA
jgi:signal peptidase I